MTAGPGSANFFIHVPRLNGKGDILAVQSSNVELQTVQVLVDRVKDRVARKPGEYGTVVEAVEIRFEDDSEPIEFEAESSLELLNCQLSPSGEVRRDAKAWPQVWAVMEKPSQTGPGETLNGDPTKGASLGGDKNGSSPLHPPTAAAPVTPVRGPIEREEEQKANFPNSPTRSQERLQERIRLVSDLMQNQVPSQRQASILKTLVRKRNTTAQPAEQTRERITAVLDLGGVEPAQNAERESDAGTSGNSQRRTHKDLPDFDEGLVSDGEEGRNQTAAGVETASKKRGRKPGPVAGKKRKADAGESSKGAKRPAIDKGEKKKGAKESAKEKENEGGELPSKRQAAAPTTARVQGDKADAGIDKAHYKNIVSKAGCSKQVSSMLTTSTKKNPRKTFLYRIKNGKEVRKGKFDSIFSALEAAKEDDIIEQWGEANEAWFNLNKRVTLRGHQNHPAVLCDKWSLYPAPLEDCGFKPFIEVQASASGLHLGPNVMIRCSTDKTDTRQTVAVHVREGARDIVLDHVTICGDALQHHKNYKKPRKQPGGFGIVFDKNTSAEMRHCRVGNHELTGVQARRGSKLTLRDCDVFSNGDSGIWGLGSSDMVIADCTVRDNAQGGICIDGLPSSIAGCLIKDNHLDGLWLDWPNKTRVAGSDERKAKERICKEGHVVKGNYITGNDHGMVVEEGVAIRLDGNVFEKNRIAGVYFDEVRPGKQIDFPCQLEGCRSIIVRNNIFGERPGDKLVHDKKRKLPKVDMDA